MQRLRTMHLFSGAGGGILADLLLGHQPVCAVEINAYCQQVLSARQKDGCFPWFPIFADVAEFDGKPWRGIVDIIAGGFPCQDISVAGKGKGITGERSGLWKEFARIIGEVRPRQVFIENSPMLINRGLATVLSDLTEMGYGAKWGIVSAADVGAPHKRERIWILGDAHDDGYVAPEVPASTASGGNDSSPWPNTPGEPARPGEQYAQLADADIEQADAVGRIDQQRRNGLGRGEQTAQQKDQESSPNDPSRCGENHIGWWEAEPNICRVVDGLAARVDRLKAIGNGQVPRVAAKAFKILI